MSKTKFTKGDILYLCRSCSSVNKKKELRDVSQTNNTKMCKNCKGKIFYSTKGST